MKTIKKVFLKEATPLSLEEMKHVFGGSAASPETIISSSCKMGTTCYVKTSGATYGGTCTGEFVSGAVRCYCNASGGKTVIGVSHCFRGN